MRSSPDPAIRRRYRHDRFAAVLVRMGGVGVVLAVMFLAAFLVFEAAPLSRGPEVGEAVAAAPVPIDPGLLGGVEPFGEAAWIFDADGVLRLHSTADGAELERHDPLGLGPDEHVAEARLAPEANRIVVATDAGRLALFGFEFLKEYDEEVGEGGELNRTHTLGVSPTRWLVDEPGAPLQAFAARDQDTRLWAAAVRDGRAEVIRATIRTNRLTGEESLRRKTMEVPGAASAVALELLENGAMIAALPDGCLQGWRPDSGFVELVDLGTIAAGAPVEEMVPMIGAGSLLVRRADGTLDRALLQAGETSQRLAAAEGFGAPVDGLRAIAVSPRGRDFLALGADSFVVGHATSMLVEGGSELPADTLRLAISPREDRVLLFRESGLGALELDLGYPEITPKTLFGKLQYEGLEAPDYTWQTSSGSDEYEAKYSFVPLIVGTLKGTFWALLPSIPLAILGALYTARFLRGRGRETVKPFVELLAGIPSVVLGFVGALWIAPAIEERMISLILLPLVLCAVTLLLGVLWARLPLATRRRFHEGRAPLLLIPAYLLLGWGIFAMGPWLEQTLLGMPFRFWAGDTFGVTVEQKNAVVVGLAMGFAVTPLIFTLAEDAFRNVPKELSDASLALGATPWQTAVRVILPPALPGVVAAIMLGLGRAVGETMIVLMATGNTPITDWNPLQGFRTLAANLAVELPESDHGGTLYRTLFLSAVLLFAMTFAVNTLAEVIRARGRKDL